MTDVPVEEELLPYEANSVGTFGRNMADFAVRSSCTIVTNILGLRQATGNHRGTADCLNRGNRCCNRSSSEYDDDIRVR